MTGLLAPPRVQRQLQLEPRPRVFQCVAEQLAQLRRPVAHGLRVDAELGGHRARWPQCRSQERRVSASLSRCAGRSPSSGASRGSPVRRWPTVRRRGSSAPGGHRPRWAGRPGPPAAAVRRPPARRAAASRGPSPSRRPGPRQRTALQCLVQRRPRGARTSGPAPAPRRRFRVQPPAFRVPAAAAARPPGPAAASPPPSAPAGTSRPWRPPAAGRLRPPGPSAAAPAVRSGAGQPRRRARTVRRRRPRRSQRTVHRCRPGSIRPGPPPRSGPGPCPRRPATSPGTSRARPSGRRSAARPCCAPAGTRRCPGRPRAPGSPPTVPEAGSPAAGGNAPARRPPRAGPRGRSGPRWAWRRPAPAAAPHR